LGRGLRAEGPYPLPKPLPQSLKKKAGPEGPALLLLRKHEALRKYVTSIQNFLCRSESCSTTSKRKASRECSAAVNIAFNLTTPFHDYHIILFSYLIKQPIFEKLSTQAFKAVWRLLTPPATNKHFECNSVSKPQLREEAADYGGPELGSPPVVK
jgi:hypothetical protein